MQSENVKHLGQRVRRVNDEGRGDHVRSEVNLLLDVGRNPELHQVVIRRVNRLKVPGKILPWKHIFLTGLLVDMQVKHLPVAHQA